MLNKCRIYFLLLQKKSYTKIVISKTVPWTWCIVLAMLVVLEEIMLLYFSQSMIHPSVDKFDTNLAKCLKIMLSQNIDSSVTVHMFKWFSWLSALPLRGHLQATSPLITDPHLPLKKNPRKRKKSIFIPLSSPLRSVQQKLKLYLLISSSKVLSLWGRTSHQRHEIHTQSL